MPNAIKTEPAVSATFASQAEATEGQRVAGASETTKISLFEDTLKETVSCLYNQPQALLDKYTRQTNLTTEMFKLNHRGKISRKKQIKLTPTHLSRLQCKHQAKQYEKTPTIQKLLSLLAPNDVASIKAKIQKSRYSPRVYIRTYHDIAKRKALGQL